jgi:hypothetical protein
MIGIDDGAELAVANSDFVITLEKNDIQYNISLMLVGVPDGLASFAVKEDDFSELKYISGDVLMELTHSLCDRTKQDHSELGITFYYNTLDSYVMIGMKFDSLMTSPIVVIDGEIIDILDMTSDLPKDERANFTYQNIVEFFRDKTTLH